MACRIGVISDTHGLLRPEAVDWLCGSNRILHAGDVGEPKILDRLAAIAPLHAVRGNVDRSGICAELPAKTVIEVEGVSIYMLHDIADLDVKPDAAGINIVVYGHSHRAKVERTADGVLFFNPGSAGPRRFRLPITVGELLVEDGAVEARVHTFG